VSTKRRLITNSASGLAERLVNLFVQVWLYQYLIKRISPEEYSLYPLVSALLVFVPPLTVILSAGLSRDTVEAHARHDDRRVTELTSTMFPVLFAAAVGLALFGLIATKYLDSILKIAPADLSEARVMVLLLFGSLVLRVILTPFGIGLFVREKFLILNVLTMLSTVLRVALLFILLLGAGPRVLWVVVATIAPDVLYVLVTTVLSIRELPAQKFRFDHIRWSLLPGLMSFGLWNMIGSIGVMIRKSSDVLVLNRFATAVDVDTFQLACLPDNQIDSVLDKMNQPATPFMVALHTTGGVEGLQDFCVRGGRYATWAALFVATPLIAFRQQVWSLYLGDKIHVYSAVPIVMVLLLGRYWIEAPFYIVGMAAYAMRRMRGLSILVIAASTFNVGITIYFVHVRHLGALGSALGTLVCVSIWTPLIIGRFCLTLLKLDISTWIKGSFLKGTIPSAVALLVGEAWNRWVRPITLPQLLLAVAVTSLFYLVTLLLFCLDQDEYGQLKSLFLKLFRQEPYDPGGFRNEI
jgi:O-antigen/teichoic acid export membrane protein